jgi:CBS domain-containing protein
MTGFEAIFNPYGDSIMIRQTVEAFLDSMSTGRDLPVIRAGSCIGDAVREMVKDHHRRILYVVDADGKPKGTITLNHLKDAIFHYYLDGRVEDAVIVSRRITELLAPGIVDDLMDAQLITSEEDEELGAVIARMIENDLSDVPVLGKDGRIVANLDILDILELWLQMGEGVF